MVALANTVLQTDDHLGRSPLNTTTLGGYEYCMPDGVLAVPSDRGM